MGFLRSLFGPSKDEIWGQVAAALGARHEEGGFFTKSKVVLEHGEWEITLDTFTRSSGSDTKTSSTRTYTRMRAPYVNADGFRFEVYREGLFSGIGRALGMQDVTIGHEPFDRNFVVKGNDAEKLRQLFGHPEVRRLVHAQPNIHFEVKDDEGWFSRRFPDGVDELYFEAYGVIKDPGILLQLFDLFSAVLNHLCHLGSAYEDDPGIRLG